MTRDLSIPSLVSEAWSLALKAARPSLVIMLALIVAGGVYTFAVGPGSSMGDAAPAIAALVVFVVGIEFSLVVYRAMLDTGTGDRLRLAHANLAIYVAFLFVGVFIGFFLLILPGILLKASGRVDVDAETPPEVVQAALIDMLPTAYGAVLRHKRSMGCILTGGFAFACMFTYFAESALVFTRVYGVAEQDYGLLFALNVLGLMAANFLNGRVVGRFGAFAMLAVGAALVWLGAMVLLAVAWTGFGGLWGLVLPLMLVVGSLGLVGANAMAAALEPFGDRAGLAASLQGFMQMTIGALAAFLVGQFHDGSAMPMAVTIAVLASLSLAARVFLVGNVPRDAQPS